MKLILFLAVMLDGCACNPTIECWYTTYHNNQYSTPSFGLMGRTVGVMSSDVRGPIFSTQESLQTYIRDQNLKMCGKAQ